MALRPARRPPAAAGRSKLSPRTPSLGLHYSQGQLPPVGRLVHPHPPLLEQEELLATVLGGVEDLTRLEVNVRKFAVEPFYLLFRQRLEDVHQREDHILFSLDRDNNSGGEITASFKGSISIQLLMCFCPGKCA